ncbi:MAG: 30S ribosomal protein S17 [Patescibacteria group bacterium]
MAKKQLKGKIVSNKMLETVVVKIVRIKEHKKYKRRYKTQKKYKADTLKKVYNVGDTVLIEECSPISKDKKWKVIKRLAESKLIEAEEIIEPEIEKKEEIKTEEKTTEVK